MSHTPNCLHCGCHVLGCGEDAKYCGGCANECIAALEAEKEHLLAVVGVFRDQELDLKAENTKLRAALETAKTFDGKPLTDEEDAMLGYPR